MLNKRDITRKCYLSKDLTTDQTLNNLIKKTNTANLKFSGTLGYGAADGATTFVLMPGGGFDDQKITATFTYVSPTTAGVEDMGALLRLQSADTPASYYYARVNAGFAKITKVISGTFTTMTQTAFVVAQNQPVQITFSAVGNVLSASFLLPGTGTQVDLAASDTQIPSAGSPGYRSLTATVFCKSFVIEQL